MDIDTYAQQLEDQGFFIISQAFSASDIMDMRTRLEAIVQGFFVRAGRRFQADTDSGLYEDVEKAEMGYRGPDVAYRKISDLEYDEVFLSKLQSSWIRDVCTRFLGETTSIMRVTMMNKPARGGTPLPWHQDASLDWPTQVQPKLALWFSLDDASAATGSLEVIPGSHKHGIHGRGHFLPREIEAQYAPDSEVMIVELRPGDVLFFDALLLHRSGVNRSDTPRRAVNAILMPGSVLHMKTQTLYPVLSGQNELRPEAVAMLNAIPG